MGTLESGMCFYCREYYQVTQNYPLNEATYDIDSFTPRCNLHWEYECSKCKRMTHFNGISWCSSCKEFTCLRCVEEKMERKEFLVYDYYYNIPCHKCKTYNPALDFAEYNGTHPYQIGDLFPKEDVVVWMPISTEEIQSQEFPHKAWGIERILSTGKATRHKRLDSLDEYTPKSSWDAIAPTWAPIAREGKEYHHTHIILPEVYRLLDAQKNEIILDVACGEGTVARHLTKSGAKVTGIDISKMLDYGIEIEKKEKLGINFMNLSAEKICDKFESASFDKVVCNMALMDIEDYKITIKNISYVLKENGIFVFSITHPAFAWPTCTSFRIPSGSQRNEDRVRIVLNYFDERPTLIAYGNSAYRNDTPLLQFPKPISSYLNELVKNNLVLREMSEPRASEEIVKKFPRKAYMDEEEFPDFLIVKAVKKSNI
ncbi:MAG: class I SAM-dependent methyltransferase [Candidatus Heimdallarchaeota archaeon]|nr:class I SAM-dependent methyltransferase [Candidatus Heimdallarchaeota archaeon]MCK4769556.1 class I SAM-dependent methyltransferase [Candidatus Heimdallarchaeota archaeon]